MANTTNKEHSFDLLDQLGDREKIKTLEANIQKQTKTDVNSRLDAIEQEINEAIESKGSSEEIIDGIIKSNFKNLDGDVQRVEGDLQELMLHLRSMLDSCGGEFANLQELNDKEQKLVDNATKAREEAEKAVEQADEMSDAWNLLFGLKNRKQKATKEEVQQKIEELKAAEQQAQRLYRERLKNADIGENLNRIISQVQGMVGIVETLIIDVDKQIDALKTRKEIAFETKEKSATMMAKRKQELEDIEQHLQAAESELTELPNNSAAYTEQQKKIADLREQRVELKGKFNVALGIFQSKERFVDQIVIHLEAQTTSKNNLKQLIGQLKSDTEERVTTYQSGLQLIQSATAQEAASMYEDAGVKTDQAITEIAAKVLMGSEKDRLERVKKHPKRMSELHKVLVAMAEATAKFKEEDAKMVEEHSKKYGIDVTETFSHSYENNKAKTSETAESNTSTSVNDLMD